MRNLSYPILIVLFLNALIAFMARAVLFDDFYLLEGGVLQLIPIFKFVALGSVMTIIMLFWLGIMVDEAISKEKKMLKLVDHLIDGDIEETPLDILGEQCPTVEDYQQLDNEQRNRLAAAACVKLMIEKNNIID